MRVYLDEVQEYICMRRSFASDLNFVNKTTSTQSYLADAFSRSRDPLHLSGREYLVVPAGQTGSTNSGFLLLEFGRRSEVLHYNQKLHQYLQCKGTAIGISLLVFGTGCRPAAAAADSGWSGTWRSTRPARRPPRWPWAPPRPDRPA
jgi:hypothetical protein